MLNNNKIKLLQEPLHFLKGFSQHRIFAIEVKPDSFFVGENLALQREVDKTSKLAAASSSASVSHNFKGVIATKLLERLGYKITLEFYIFKELLKYAIFSPY